MSNAMNDAARLRITLIDLDPAPWREVEVPLSMTFKALHHTIQAAFQWFDCHLWEFDFAGRRYGLPFDDDFGDDKVFDAGVARLTKLPTSKVSEFLYIYDMGDYWRHRIEIVEFIDAPIGSRLPKFLDGKWLAPPEDIGGPPGFEMFLDILGNPDHEEHDDLMDWYDGPFDNEDIGEEYINIQMGRLANMRRPKSGS